MSQEQTNHALDNAAVAASQVSTQAHNAAQRGITALQTGTQHLLDRAQGAGDHTSAYIRAEPVKAMLIAAAAGAALMAVVGLLTGTRHR